jgi:hypothetical protein
MHWPLRRRPRAAAPVTPSAEAPTARQPRLELHPERSRPRADWAHLESLRPVSATAAPLTFHGERFGRSVAGARPLLRPPLPRRSGAAPAGVLLDIAAVETIVPPAPAPAPTPVEHPASNHPVAQHRPTVAKRTVDPLIHADEALPPIDWQPATPRVAPPPDTPLSWTPDDGFQQAAAAGSLRRIRRRPGAPASEAAETAADIPPDIAPDDEPIRRGEPHLRYVPTSHPRTVADERPAPPPDVVRAVAAATGVHVGDAIIDRSSTAADQAEDLGAVAFTRHGVVHLPAELGPLDDPAVRSVVAHELTHVAQHRRRDGDLPLEHTQEGRLLEAEARAVQRQIAGGPVRPTFRRRRQNEVREGPIGVQRLAHQTTEYEGPDYSEFDFSLIEPRGSEDIFAWQEREGEPREVPWTERHAWAERFERDNSHRLQRARDARYRAMAEAAGQTLVEAGLPALRRRLDQEMPYQFGGPFDVDPYPDVPLGGSPVARDGSAGSAAAAATATTAVATARTARTVAPPDQVALAEGDASRRELRSLAASTRRTVHAEAEIDTYAEMVERLERRRTLERDMRIHLLAAKSDAAHVAQAPGSHVVPLTRQEIDEIREVVDEVLPADGIDYLDLDDHSSRTVAGAYGQFVEEQPAPFASHRRPPLPTTSALATGSAPRAHTAPDAAPHAEPEHAPGAADQLLARLRSIDAAPVDAVFELSRDELIHLMEARHAREGALRQELLRARRTDLGDLSRLPRDFVVCLSSADLQAIRVAVDELWPQLVGIGLYRGDDEFASVGLTSDDWGDFVAEPESVEDAIARKARETAQAEAPTATGATATASPPLAPATQGPTATATTATATIATATGVATTPPTTAMAGPSAAAPAETTSGATSEATPPVPALQPAVGEAGEAPIGTVDALTELDLERLTRRLWGRIRRELRGELLIDRERAGALADMR